MQKKKQTGFTLIEMVIVMSLIGILAGLGGLLLRESTKATLAGKSYTRDMQAGAMALQRMSRELRAAKDSEIIIISPTHIQFVETGGDALEYRLQGTTLERKQNAGPWRSLLNNVVSLIFSSFSQNGMDYMTIALGINRGGGTLNLRSSIFPRNH